MAEKESEAMSLHPEDEQDLFDDIAAAVEELRKAMDTRNVKWVGEVRQLSLKAYCILKPWLRKDPSQ